MEKIEPELSLEGVLKERTVKVRYYYAGGEAREVSENEAKMILSETYNNNCGGFIIDMKTNRVIDRISADVEEIMVLEGVVAEG